jgi:uncharacterized protein YbaP (TraB family)
MIALTLRRTLAGALLALAALLAAAEPPRAQPAAAAGCPPEVQPPTAQQIEHGVRHHARDRGFLWRLQRDGRTSYLYGTIHLGRFEWAFPGPTVLAALRDAQVLALELDLNDPQTMQRTMALALREAPGLLDDTRAARLARQLDAQCLPQAAVASMHPVFQAMTLTMLAGRHDGFDPAWAQEAVLTGAAQALQRRVVALETPERQVQALLASDLAGQRYLLDSALTQLEDGSTRRGLHRLAEVWERGDLARLADYESWCECVRSETGRQFMRELNDARNPGLADGIAALHRGGQTVFAAVGALHMVGPQALPRLLAERGFVVERIAFGR